jgi:hypothetical protein
MELNKKKKLVITGFAVIYIVFAVILLYLFFLSPNIQLKEIISNSGKQVYLINSTEREIHNIEVYFYENNEKKIIESVNLLKPGEQKEINLTQFKGMQKIKLFAEAPYHNIFELEISLESAEINLSYNIKSPKTIFKNTEFELILEICNSGKPAKEIKIMQAHEQEIFKEESKTHFVSVQNNECKEIKYNLTPLNSGLTVILFNIEFENNTGNVTKELLIKETEEYSEQISKINEID